MKNWARFYCKLPDYDKQEKTVIIEITDNVKDHVWKLFGSLFEIELLSATVTLLNDKKQLYKYEFEITKHKSLECKLLFQSIAFKSIINSVKILNN